MKDKRHSSELEDQATFKLFFLMFVAQQKLKDPKKEAWSMCGRQAPIL